MSFDWGDYLRLAAILEDNTPDDAPLSEAAFRSAASRAYYAAFHYAKEHARTEGFWPSHQGDDHQNVQRHYRNHDHSVRREIAAKLDRMLKNRNKADYRTHLNSTPRALAAVTVRTAESVVELIDSLVHTD